MGRVILLLKGKGRLLLASASGFSVFCFFLFFAFFLLSLVLLFLSGFFLFLVGLSLYSCRSIGVAPVRGGTYFSLSPKGTSFGASSKEK
ncbi:hypothetical protein R54767_01835 [Paraburkholderia gardini]|uniref:Transmembrane protein n=1 Tax=Paraburkholderia gardini TaxID=2823469 RepID=A0ABM8U1X7_9BURK|nr:hypothetical protein R54767_01835 [Paraburkholderia gardini]